MVGRSGDDEADFEDFVRRVEPRLRAALVARYGSERGREATAEALAYAWQERTRVLAMQNPVGYLYRVGQSQSRRRKAPPLPPPRPVVDEHRDPALERALDRLSARQRTVVVLVHGEGWTMSEVGALLGISKPTVQRHADRGLAKLRQALGVEPERGDA